MPPEPTHQAMEKLMKANKDLLEENNKLLKKIYRNGVWGFWIRVMWYVLLIGLPFSLYFYVLEPYFDVMGSNYDTFRAGINEIPGLKGIDQILDQLGNREY